MSGVSLKDFQRSFSRALKLNTISAWNTLPLMSDDAARSRKGRNAYSYAHKARLMESLEDDFPRIRKLLGPAAFSNLIIRYLDKYPSRSHTLLDLGRHFPRFLKMQPLSGALSGVLSEIARFEWELLCARGECARHSGVTQFQGLRLNPTMKVIWSRLSMDEIVKTRKSHLHKTVFKRTAHVIFKTRRGEVSFHALDSHQIRFIYLMKTHPKIFSWDKMDAMEKKLRQHLDPTHVPQWIACWTRSGLIES